MWKDKEYKYLSSVELSNIEKLTIFACVMSAEKNVV